MGMGGRPPGPKWATKAFLPWSLRAKFEPRRYRSAKQPPGADVMITSRDRILTTHVGSLPRNEDPQSTC